jgi:uncharacterized membrane protein
VRSGITVLTIGIFLLLIYRAANISMTHDEAQTFFSYLDGPWSMTLDYDPNNHILNTFLMKLSILAFGTSTFVLRIPALLGGLVYMGAASGFCKRLLAGQKPWVVWLVFAALTLNPILLDYFSRARGYSLALGFLMAGVFFCYRALQGDTATTVYLTASLCFGLSLAPD